MPTKPRKTKTKGWSVRACWTDINGKQQKRTESNFPSSRAATLWAVEFEEQNQYKAGDAHCITTKDFLIRWLQSRISSKNGEKNTIRNYKNDIEKMLPHIGDIPLRELRLDQVDAMLTKIDGAPRTVQMVRNTLSTALNYACRTSILDKNVASLATCPKQRKYKYITLSPEEALAQIEKLREMNSAFYAPFALALFAGLRRGEALGLRWIDINLKRKTIHVCNQYTLENGKPIHKALKTDGSDQIVPIPNILVDILKEIKANQSASGYIETYVCSKLGQLPSLHCFNRDMKLFQINHGFSVCRFHDLRHTFATRMLDAGVDIRTISEMLRHKSPTLAMQTYLHPGDKIKKDAAAKLNNVFEVATKKKAYRFRRKGIV